MAIRSNLATSVRLVEIFYHSRHQGDVSFLVSGSTLCPGFGSLTISAGGNPFTEFNITFTNKSRADLDRGMLCTIQLKILFPVYNLKY
jgi:hypothetical protein